MRRPTPPYRSLTENPRWVKQQCECCGGDFWLEPGKVGKGFRYCTKTCRHEPPETRFLKSITKDGPMHPTKPELGCCWNSKFTPSAEYPSMKINGVQTRLARFSLELALGRPLADGLYALHSCDNTRCVNSAHLNEGTQEKNKQECVERGRQQDMRGEKCPTAKLNNEKVKYIRENPDGLLGKELAEMFGVHGSDISSVKHRRLWKHI